MNDFENNNQNGLNASGEEQTPENTFPGNSGTSYSGADNSTSYSHTNDPNMPDTGSNPYSYQNSFYRTAPSQNHTSGYRELQQPPISGGNGYSYANYYSNFNHSASGGPKDHKTQKKHTGLKVAACIMAVLLVSGGSIGIYEGIRTTIGSNSEKPILAESAGKSKSSGENKATTQTNKNTSNAESWIELAAGDDAMSVADIVKKVTPSVVGVQATFSMEASPNDYYGNFFGFGGFGGNQGSTTQQATGVGTGIVMSEDGYIVTNAHVIYDDDSGFGEADAVQVQMYDQETTYDASIVAYDKEADIAVLQIHAEDLVPAEFGDSSSCEVGEMVVAIGNPLGLEFQNTVTCGIISALNRRVTINDNAMTLIQTDTAINSGNSGGPLINSAGQVIGINSAKMSSSYSSNSASVEGIGFAIPMTEAKEIIDDLINYGYVTGRPQLGISCQDVSESVSQAYQIPVGVYVISVTEGGAADQAGLRPADVITAIQGETVTTTEELNNVKNQYNAGDTVTLTVVRSGEKQEMKIDVALEEVTRDTE